MRKPPKNLDNDLIVPSNFLYMWCLLDCINLPAKNEQILPDCFGDRPIAIA